MVELLDYLGKEGAVILEAPLIFLTAMALLSGLIWAALRWQFQARLDRRDDEIAALRRTQASDPSEADDQYERAQVSKIWPDLAERQKQILREAVNGARPNGRDVELFALSKIGLIGRDFVGFVGVPPAYRRAIAAKLAEGQ